MNLIFATHNLNKLREVQQFLTKEVSLFGLADIGCITEIPETGSTLEENAKIKADFVTQNYEHNCFADDTGLEVDILGNEPGVYSARYAGDSNDSELNMQKLLNNLKSKSNRKAQFRTIIALNFKGEQYTFEGVCKGEILLEKQGDSGFGYDPIFKPNGFDKSFAEMTLEDKGSVSHRGIAIQKLITFLEKNII